MRQMARRLLLACSVVVCSDAGGVLRQHAALRGNAGFQCCWLGDAPCGPSWNASVCPVVPGCETYFDCTGPCAWRMPTGPAKWCQTSFSPPDDSDFDPPLYQQYRPPRQTAAQRAAMETIQDLAVELSADAEPWVLSYIGSEKFQSNLHESLRKYSRAQLLEMISWEFQRLPLFHNAPVDSWDVDIHNRRRRLSDDSPMDVALANGNLQQPCQRYVLGGPETLVGTVMYANMYVNHFHLPAKNLCDLTSSLRESNSCMMFNANDLRKTPLGNIQYGSVTYVLDSKSLAGRSFWEPFDGGAMELFDWALLWHYPAQGTTYPPAWYHLLQPHERLFSMDGIGQYKTLATTLNYWWVEGAPLPTADNGGGLFLGIPYFEVMTNGNVWLPEDLMQVQAKYSTDRKSGGGATGAEGLWGTESGEELRRWLVEHRRPLVWADRPDGPMLIDPVVASQLWPGGTGLRWQLPAGYNFSHGAKITITDFRLFESGWGKAAWNHSFDELVSQAAPHLVLRWQDWFHRKVCAEIEQNASNHVMGIDGDGQCVFWTSPPLSSSASQSPQRSPRLAGWECLNDGTCELAELPSPRATFASKEECLSQCGSTWECVRDVPFASYSGTAYCLPRVANASTSNAKCGIKADEPCEAFPSLESCEAGCQSRDPSRHTTCAYNWWDIIVSSVITFFLLRLLLLVVVLRCVAPRQKFRSSISGCCPPSLIAPLPSDGVGGADADVQRLSCRSCLWVTCCPCFQYFRVLAFLWGEEGQSCCGCFCVVSTLCGLCPPIALGYCALNLACGCCFDACTRFMLRRKLGIKGRCWEDITIHLGGSTCARNQEAQEISVRGYDDTKLCYGSISASDLVNIGTERGSAELRATLREPILPLRTEAAQADPNNNTANVNPIAGFATIESWTIEDHHRVAAMARERRAVLETTQTSRDEDAIN